MRTVSQGLTFPKEGMIRRPGIFFLRPGRYPCVSLEKSQNSTVRNKLVSFHCWSCVSPTPCHVGMLCLADCWKQAEAPLDRGCVFPSLQSLHGPPVSAPLYPDGVKHADLFGPALLACLSSSREDSAFFFGFYKERHCFPSSEN